MSTILRAYKFRLYPNEEQATRFAQQFGSARFIFNHFLAENIRRFDAKEKHLSGFDCGKIITQMKKDPETKWLKEVDDWVLKNAATNLDIAYKNFFSSISGKRKGPKVARPKFKCKGNRDSFKTTCKLDQNNRLLKIPKLSPIKVVIDRTIAGKIKTATVSKTPSGKYFVSILVEESINLLPSTGREIGIDLGLKDLIITSDGEKFPHPEQMLAKAKRELKKQQRKLARKVKGSKNRERQRIKVAKAFEKVTNIKKDYYHNLSRYLVNNFDAIYLENLNVSGMLKNRRLSRKIHESAWSTLAGMIAYKAGWAGRTIHKIGRFVPSSKTCSCCGYKKTDLTLGDRSWDCPSCGSHLDRDINAAQNIKNFGQLDCYGQVLPSAATTEVGILPMGLQKFAIKIERSDVSNSRLAKGATKPKSL